VKLFKASFCETSKAKSMTHLQVKFLHVNID